MSEQQQFAPSAPVPADFDGDAFDEWIAGATVSKRSVPIYGKPGLYAEYEDLERQLEKARQVEGDQSELAGSEASRIEKRMGELYEEWIGSKSTWIVRALSEDEIEALKAEDPESGRPELVEPKQPTEPEAPELPAKPTDQQQKSHTIRQQEHEKARAAYETEVEEYEKAARHFNAELNLRAISAAVERIEFANGRVTDGVTVEQLRKMKARLGERQILSLVTATRLAAMTEPEIPGPFSRSSSKDDPTS